MKVLLTNDDGIQAQGLQSLRRALIGIEGLDLGVVAPNSNRSATARSITTRSPLGVQELTFDDGTTGFATDGTPVDCVRFADLGLVGERPELIVSGINHGANLGDDITYSGTVAAALEGIVLGIPSIAVSQQSIKGEMGYRFGREFNFSYAARFARDLVQLVIEKGIPAGTLINVNCPAGRPDGVEVGRLGKRIYDDELKLVEEDPDTGLRHYRIYGFEPSHEDEPGTDLHAIANNRVAVTPLHFDLTHYDGLDDIGGWGLDTLHEAAAAAVDAAQQQEASGRR